MRVFMRSNSIATWPTQQERDCWSYLYSASCRQITYERLFFAWVFLASMFDFSGLCRSLGCTVVEMLSGNPPWHNFEGIAAIYRIATSPAPEYKLPPSTSNVATDFLLLCFIKEYNQRPTAVELLSNPFVNEFSWNGLFLQTVCSWTAPLKSPQCIIDVAPRLFWV